MILKRSPFPTSFQIFYPPPLRCYPALADLQVAAPQRQRYSHPALETRLMSQAEVFVTATRHLASKKRMPFVCAAEAELVLVVLEAAVTEGTG